MWGGSKEGKGTLRLDSWPLSTPKSGSCGSCAGVKSSEEPSVVEELLRSRSKAPRFNVAFAGQG